MAKITTVIPVFNGERFITATLTSLANQTLLPDRIVVLDDGSTDRTEEIVRSFKELRCDWAPNAKNLGLFPNHNNALRFAQETEFLHILHSDDLILPTFFEKLVPLVANSPGRAMAFGGHVFIGADGVETERKTNLVSGRPRKLSLKKFLTTQSELKSLQLHSVLMRTNGQPFPTQFRTDLPQLADVVFHAEFATICSEIWAYPEVLCQVRTHENSASNKNILSLNAWVIDEWRTMQLVLGLMEKTGCSTWSQRRKLRLLFAARSHVKVQSVRARNAEYAQQISRVTIEKSGIFNWTAARGIVALRDMIFPKENRLRTGLDLNEN